MIILYRILSAESLSRYICSLPRLYCGFGWSLLHSSEKVYGIYDVVKRTVAEFHYSISSSRGDSKRMLRARISKAISKFLLRRINYSSVN